MPEWSGSVSGEAPLPGSQTASHITSHGGRTMGAPSGPFYKALIGGAGGGEGGSGSGDGRSFPCNSHPPLHHDSYTNNSILLELLFMSILSTEISDQLAPLKSNSIR